MTFRPKQERPTQVVKSEFILKTFFSSCSIKHAFNKKIREQSSTCTKAVPNTHSRQTLNQQKNNTCSQNKKYQNTAKQRQEKEQAVHVFRSHITTQKFRQLSRDYQPCFLFRLHVRRSHSLRIARCVTEWTRAHVDVIPASSARFVCKFANSKGTSISQTSPKRTAGCQVPKQHGTCKVC